MSKPSNIRAWTTHPNTPETDELEFVMHTVSYEINDKSYELTLPARCPMDAIDLLHNNFRNNSDVTTNEIDEHIRT